MGKEEIVQVRRLGFEKSGSSTRAGKFNINWKRPYIIERIVGKGVYFLKALEGEHQATPWNIVHLKNFYR